MSVMFIFVALWSVVGAMKPSARRNANDVAAVVDAEGAVSFETGEQSGNPDRVSLLTGGVLGPNRDEHYDNRVCGGTGVGGPAPGKSARAFRWLKPGTPHATGNINAGLGSATKEKCQQKCDELATCSWFSFHDGADPWCIGCVDTDGSATAPTYYTKGFIKNENSVDPDPSYDNRVCPPGPNWSPGQRSFRWTMLNGGDFNAGSGDPTEDGCKAQCESLADCAWFSFFDSSSTENADKSFSGKWCIGCKGAIPTQGSLKGDGVTAYTTEGYLKNSV